LEIDCSSDQFNYIQAMHNIKLQKVVIHTNIKLTVSSSYNYEINCQFIIQLWN